MIYELNKIDLFSTRPSEPEKLYLCITDELGWEEDLEDHLLLLQQKLENYTNYVLAKGYEAGYPDSRFTSFVFLLCCAHEPCKEALELMGSIQQYMNAHGLPIQLSYRLIPPQS